PSFCDETLFGAKPWAAPRMRREDVAKLHSLLWSPPPAPRTQPAASPCSRDTPLRAVHPTPTAPGAAGSERARKGKSCGWKRPESGRGVGGQGAPRSQSLHRLNSSSGGLCLAPDTPRAGGCNSHSPATAPAAPALPPARARSRSVSRPPPARSSAAAGGCKPRPPWK
ncbi:RITA1 protein, partial [Pterocles burchelli]|nr:RITA1 protein [Pterocles burchelli]